MILALAAFVALLVAVWFAGRLKRADRGAEPLATIRAPRPRRHGPGRMPRNHGGM
jgi:hypothetical protein